MYSYSVNFATADDVTFYVTSYFDNSVAMTYNVVHDNDNEVVTCRFNDKRQANAAYRMTQDCYAAHSVTALQLVTAA
jgi:hypothetical protein